MTDAQPTASKLHLSFFIYAGWPSKNVALYFCPYLHQLSTDFRNSFTGALCSQFAI